MSVMSRADIARAQQEDGIWQMYYRHCSARLYCSVALLAERESMQTPLSSAISAGFVLIFKVGKEREARKGRRAEDNAACSCLGRVLRMLRVCCASYEMCAVQHNVRLKFRELV